MATKRSVEQLARQLAAARRIASRLSRRGAKSELFRKVSRVPGVSGEVDFYRKLSGKVRIGRELLTAICNTLRIHPGWVLTGRGDVEMTVDMGVYHSPAENDAINARLMASDRVYWRRKFSGENGRRDLAGSIANHLDLALRQLDALQGGPRLSAVTVNAMARLRDQLIEEVVLPCEPAPASCQPVRPVRR